MNGGCSPWSHRWFFEYDSLHKKTDPDTDQHQNEQLNPDPNQKHKFGSGSKWKPGSWSRSASKWCGSAAKVKIPHSEHEYKKKKCDKNLSSGGRSPAKRDRNHVQLKSKKRLHYGVQQTTRIKAGFLDHSNISRMVTCNLIFVYFDRKVAEIRKYYHSVSVASTCMLKYLNNSQHVKNSE